MPRFATGLSGGDSARSTTKATARPAPHVNQAAWVYRPASVTQMAQGSDAAFVATVTAVAPGSPLLTEADPRTGENVPPIPTQRVTLTILDRWFGASPGQVVLFKTGSDNEYIAGDPPYAAGDRYVIFLGGKRGDGSYLPAGPDGRLQVVNGRLKSLIEGPVADRLDGLSLNGARQLAQAAKGGR